MDIFRRKKFDEAMFAKNRTLAIRVGQYQSSDIKEASFDYGYIKGDTYKPGGTCAGSGKITFTSIITSFNKLDKIYPEIGLLVDGTYEWVKMGEYFINDIEIDRNRKTTKLDLMDGMFKLNREHVTDLTYPAEVRHVIKEICLKTGVELANENMDIASMNYVIENIPKDKKMTFRDVLSLATQMLGMSCFFNREGKLEIKELTDSSITITADSYFMHGLTKSEVQYQIAGITCKKDKEALTVGMRTGRSLELDNPFMTQSILDNLYHKIKDIRYYPFNLNYQGHLLLNVGEWVTIKTNTGETFKSPVLNQSFTFKGGLRGRISADSKAGNDAQYSYAGTLTKKIEQFSEFEKQIQNQIEEADKGFGQKVDKIKKDFSDQVELAKARAEEVKRELSDTIEQRFSSFNNGPLQEAKRRAEEALRNAGASTLLAQEAKRISEQATADITKLKNEVVGGYVGKNTYQEGIRGIERRIEEVKTSTDGKIATQIAQYKQTIDGQFANITSQIANKANQTDFQRVQETSRLYERIIGSNENDISNKVARMALTNQLFQVEVSKYVLQGGPNLVKNSGNPQDSKNWGYWEIGQNPAVRVGTHDFFFKNKRNLFYVVNKTRESVPASTIRFPLKRNTSYTVSLTAFNTWNMKGATIYFLGRKAGENQTFTRVVTLADNVKFSSDEAVRKNYIFDSGECDEGFIRIDNNGTTDSDVAILLFGDVDVYEGTVTRPWQPSPEDDNEAVRSVQSQLAGSWAVQNLTSAGSIVSQINATNNQILIEAEKIRLKGKTLLDELTAIDGYFKRLFVGEGAFAKLNAEIIGSKTITADKLIMDKAMARMFVSSDIFTDTLAAKEAFINKLRSVVVSATLLEGFKGRIGGFQIGTHDKDPSTYWLTGQNQFYVGMSNGAGNWGKTALWVNWGTTWDAPGNYAWFVKESGEMFCYNRAYFWNTPVINGDLRVTGDIYYNNKNSGKSGYWIYSPQYKQIFSENGYMYFVWGGGGSDWIPLNKEISDRRYKHNIEASTVSGLDVIEQLKTYSYRKEYDDKIEDIACGIMAQDVQKYIPEAFYENPDGAYSYRTFELVPYLIKAIQELNQKIEKLEKTA
jgi:pblB|nr:MAG TPA: Neck appendage protein [Caudoviricetes sp.]